MALDLIHLERRHEHAALIDAAGPLLGRKLFKTATRDQDFVRILLATSNTIELGAGTVQLRRVADRTGPTTVVPWHANGQMAQRVIVIHGSSLKITLYIGQACRDLRRCSRNKLR
ncbi:hypothetical protein D3C84_998850 [compost metagenome]